MNDADRKKRNDQRLTECHPWFRERLEKVLHDMEQGGWKPRIQDAHRWQADQLKAFNSGHSKLRYGYHNCTGPNGEKWSFAVDVLREDGSVLVSEKEYCIALAHTAMQYDLETGILWGLRTPMTEATREAVIAAKLGAPVKIGWDPTHIQPRHLRLIDLKNGKFPK